MVREGEAPVDGQVCKGLHVPRWAKSPQAFDERVQARGRNGPAGSLLDR